MMDSTYWLSVRAFLLLVFITTILNTNAYSQQGTTYTKYTLEQFIEEKTNNKLEYLQHIYRSLKYPPKMRTEEIEDSTKVIMFHNSDNNQMEIISFSEHNANNELIQLTLEQANNQYLLKDDSSFLVEFEIHFNLYPFEIKTGNLIQIVAYRPPVLWECH